MHMRVDRADEERVNTGLKVFRIRALMASSRDVFRKVWTSRRVDGGAKDFGIDGFHDDRPGRAGENSRALRWRHAGREPRQRAIERGKNVGGGSRVHAHEADDTGRAGRHRRVIDRAAVEWPALLVDHDEIVSEVSENLGRVTGWRLHEGSDEDFASNKPLTKGSVHRRLLTLVDRG